MNKENTLIFLLKKISWPFKLVSIAIIISSLGSIIGLLVPLYTGKIVDDFSLKSINSSFVLSITIIFILNSLLSGLGYYLLNKVGEKIIYSIRFVLWKHIIYLKIPFFDENESGQLISRLTDDTKVINDFISQKLPNALPSLITFIGSLIMLFILDWQMTLLLFIVIPIFALIMIPLSKKMQAISTNMQLALAQFSGMISRVLTEIRLVKVSNNESFELINAKKNLDSIYNLGLKQAKVTAIIHPISSLVTLFIIGTVLGFGGIRVASNAISSGTLVSMIFYILNLSTPIIQLSTLITDYKKAEGASARIYEILNSQKEIFNTSEYNEIKNGDLIFKNVNFKYNVNPTLKNISCTITNGKMTALVGESGSGKTTFINLIERFYEIDSGDILYNNQSIYSYSLEMWRNKIGYVMQNSAMMSGTIRENILYGIHDDVSNKTLFSYAQKANCHEFIMSFNDGYNTKVGERGMSLSGGQKQRIDIARSFIKNPDILILDEATANLDSESERIIQESLNTLTKNRTTIIIAHRLSTIKKADTIIFLENGSITGIGNHQELLSSHSKYKNFVEMQKFNGNIS
ncbi:ABC transporter ATP-binding protein [Staphylococcus pseudintermedius]|nr:ABC transporter ATP-binding protein [Staphylococcus pseudintermedius]